MVLKKVGRMIIVHVLLLLFVNRKHRVKGVDFLESVCRFQCPLLAGSDRKWRVGFDDG